MIVIVNNHEGRDAVTGYTVRDLKFGCSSEPIFDGFDADFPAGEVTALIGANGTGKSTLINLMVGLLRPARGRLEPQPVRPALLAQRTEHIDGLPLTVRDCVSMGRFGSVPFWKPLGKSDRALVGQMIDRVGMTSYTGQRLRDLSGGQRQRVMIAQTMVQDAQLYLLDEPSTALDVAGREMLFGLLREKAEHGAAVVLATHDADEVAFADRVVDLGGGMGTIVRSRVAETSG